MSKIVIQNLGNKEIPAKAGGKTILELLHDNFVDWMHACGGKGRCTTCRFIVHEGMKNTSSRTKAELYYADLGELKAVERLACQTTLNGDIKISVPQDCKLPHVSYTD